MGDDEDAWKKLPIDEKIQHKSWKARMDGYEQLKKLFEQADEKSPEFAKYQHSMKNLAIDANAFAQEKGLEVIAVFVENATIANKTACDVIPGVVSKGLGARPKAKEKSIEILLMYIEIEKQDIVIDELVKSFSHKTPKNVVAAVAVVRDALTAFGNKVVPIKPLLKVMPNLFIHKEKLVREEAKLLSIEMFKWVNVAVKQALSGIPPVALKELEEEWGKLPVGAPPLPTRFLRSQHEYKAKVEAAAAAQTGASSDKADGGAVVEAIDPYEMMEPVEILSKIPADFLTQLEDKKWSIRKDALTTLKTLAAAPKLEPGDYGDIVRSLKKIIAKDTNVMVVTVAAECVSALANGLRKKFGTYSSFVFGSILERFKEKKQTVVEALRGAADAVIKSNKLDSFVEDTLEQLESKSPNVKSETLLVWKRYLLVAKPSEMPKSLIKQLMPVLKKRMDESLVEIRDSCYELLAALWKLVGEKNIMPFIGDVDKLKLDKIKETYEKLTASADKAPEEGAKPATAAPPAKAPGSAPAQKPGPPGARSGTGKAAPVKQSGADAKKKPVKETPRETIERELDDGAVEAIREEHFSEEMRGKMDSMNWKERQEAMEDFKKKLMLLEPEKIPAQAFVRILGGKNNFKETNFNVMIQKFVLLGEVARLGKFSKTSFQICAQPLVDKIGDIKSGKDAKNALTEIAEKVGFPIVVEDVITLAMNQKNPKNQSECFLWVSDNIKLFGFKGLNSKFLCDKIKTCLLASNPQVRQAAVTLAGVMHMYMGPQVRLLFESEKATTLQLIDAEFEKVKDLKPEAPTRGAVHKVGPGGDAGSSQAAEEEPEPEDLMPRTDISGKVTEELLGKLADSKWKIREEGLQNVQAIIKESAFITPNLGELPSALCKRLGDTNKILASTTAGICSELANALGSKGCKQHFKTFAPALINMLTDAKPSVRQSATKALDDWAEKCPLNLVFEDEIVLTALKSPNVNLRNGLLTWLEKQLAVCRPLPAADLIPCVLPLFTSLEDRNGDVRKAAQGACLYFLAHAGYDKIFRQTSKLSPTSQATIGKQLEGMRDNIPDIRSKFKADEKQAAPPVVSDAEPVQSVTASKPVTKAIAQSKAVEQSAAAAMSDADSDAGSDSGAKKPAKAAAPTGKGAPKSARASTAKGRQSTVAKTKGAAEEEDVSPPLTVGKGKESREQRLKDENSHKLLKWNFNMPTKEHIQQLNELMATVCSKSLHTLLFHADFKFHLQAMEKLMDFSTADNRDSIVANVDLILKWSTLRLFDTNTTVIFKVLDLILCVMKVCNDGSFTLSDSEASSFVPYMVSLRIGDPKEEIRKKAHAILKALPSLYGANKVFAYLMDGTKQKNARGRSESLEAMAKLVEEFGMGVCHPTQQKSVKDVAAIIGDKDGTVRNSALNFLSLVVNIVGQDMTKRWIGSLPDKQQSMFDERIKRSVKGANKGVVVEPVQDKLVGMSQIKGIQQLNKTSAGAPSSARQSVAQSANFDQSHTDDGIRSDSLERPATAAAAVSRESSRTSSNSLKYNKYFHFDFEEIEKNRTAMPPESKYYSNPEVEALLKEPFPTYEIKSRKNISSLLLLTTSQDVTETLDLFLGSITDSDLNKSFITLGQIAQLLRDEEKNVVFQAQHIQKLVTSTTLQLKMCVTHHITSAVGDSEKMEVLAELMRIMLDALSCLFKTKKLASLVCANEMHHLLAELVSASQDSNFNRLPEVEQFLKAMNELICCMINYGDRTVVIVSCLRLLTSAIADGHPKGDGAKDIAVKSCWRAMRDVVNGNQEAQMLPILTECHLFLKKFPTSYWNTSTNDKPIRTVRTLVHSFVKSQGSAASLKAVKEVPNYEESEIETLVKKAIRNINRSLGGSGQENPSVRASKTGGAVEVRGLAKSTDEIIDGFIAKAKDKSRDRNMTEACYDFMRYKLLNNPNADTARFVAVLEPHCQRWVKSVLENSYYEKARELIKNYPPDNPYPPELDNNPSSYAGLSQRASSLLLNTKQTINDWTEQLHATERQNGGGGGGGFANVSSITASSENFSSSNNIMQSNNARRSPLQNNSSAISDLNRPQATVDAEKQQIADMSASDAVSLAKQHLQDNKASAANQNTAAANNAASVDVAEFRKRLEMIKNRSNMKN